MLNIRYDLLLLVFLTISLYASQRERSPERILKKPKIIHDNKDQQGSGIIHNDAAPYILVNPYPQNIDIPPARNIPPALKDSGKVETKHDLFHIVEQVPKQYGLFGKEAFEKAAKDILAVAPHATFYWRQRSVPYSDDPTKTYERPYVVVEHAGILPAQIMQRVWVAHRDGWAVKVNRKQSSPEKTMLEFEQRVGASGIDL